MIVKIIIIIIVSQDIKQQINVPTTREDWKENVHRVELKRELEPLIAEMKQMVDVHQKALQKSDEQHQEMKNELQELHKGNNQKILEITEENKMIIEQLNTDISSLRSKWIIEDIDVELTQEVISKGVWGEVKVGVFRDARVAVMVSDNPISSDHIFSNKMLIAFGLRHPNILRFIGATKFDHPIILNEVMQISLYDQIHNNPKLTKLEILTISRDVAAALNYIHSCKPQPILHQAVSCPNVFLTHMASQWMGKLSNFGSASFQNQISPSEALRNPTYAAPECHHCDFSPAMDVYSFGVLLMETVTHHYPPELPHEKQDRIKTITWKFMKQIIQSCIKEDKKERKHISTIFVEIDHQLRK